MVPAALVLVVMALVVAQVLVVTIVEADAECLVHTHAVARAAEVDIAKATFTSSFVKKSCNKPSAILDSFRVVNCITDDSICSAD